MDEYKGTDLGVEGVGLRIAFSKQRKEARTVTQVTRTETLTWTHLGACKHFKTHPGMKRRGSWGQPQSVQKTEKMQLNEHQRCWEAK
jgi:hypothetical protein